MNDDDLKLIFSAFKLNNNEFVLELPNFRIVSDHNIASVSFFVNDLIIYREKGENKNITVNKNINIKELLTEVKTFIGEK